MRQNRTIFTNEYDEARKPSGLDANGTERGRPAQVNVKNMHEDTIAT
jgi:hypothetical protein